VDVRYCSSECAFSTAARGPQGVQHLAVAHEAQSVARVAQLVDDAPRQHRALLDRHARRRGLAGDGALARGGAVPGALARTYATRLCHTASSTP